MLVRITLKCPESIARFGGSLMLVMVLSMLLVTPSYASKPFKAKIINFNSTQRTVTLECADKCPFEESQEVMVYSKPPPKPQGFKIFVDKLDGTKAVGKIRGLLKGTKKFPPKGATVMAMAGKVVSKPEGPVKPVKKPPSGWTLGGGTPYKTPLQYVFLDFRTQLAFFSFPLYFEIGLTVGGVRYADPEGNSIFVGLPVAIRYNFPIGSRIKLGLFAGYHAAVYGRTELNPETGKVLTTGYFQNYPEDTLGGADGSLPLDLGGIIDFRLGETVGVYLRGTHTYASIGLVKTFM